MAGRIRGLAPRERTQATTARSTSVMQATPRLPAVMSTVCPGRIAPGHPARRISSLTARGTFSAGLRAKP
jgi:hypothetical protein